MEPRPLKRPPAATSFSSLPRIDPTTRSGRHTRARAKTPHPLAIDTSGYMHASLGNKFTYSPTDTQRRTSTHSALSQPRRHSTPALVPTPGQQTPPTGQTRLRGFSISAQDALELLAGLAPEDTLIIRSTSRQRSSSLLKYIWGSKSVYTRRLMHLENMVREEPCLKVLSKNHFNGIYEACLRDFSLMSATFVRTIEQTQNQREEEATFQLNISLGRISDDLEGLIKTMCFNFPERRDDIYGHAKATAQKLLTSVQHQVDQASKKPRKQLKRQLKRLGELTYRYSVKVAKLTPQTDPQSLSIVS